MVPEMVQTENHLPKGTSLAGRLSNRPRTRWLTLVSQPIPGAAREQVTHMAHNGPMGENNRIRLRYGMRFRKGRRGVLTCSFGTSLSTSPNCVRQGMHHNTYLIANIEGRGS